MAKNTFKKESEQADLVEVEGSFAPNGSSDPVAASTSTSTTEGAEGVYSITRQAAGTWRITFKERYPRLVAFSASIMMASATDLVPQFGAYVAPTATARGYIDLRAQAGAVATDIAANASNRVSFCLTFKRTAKRLG